MILRRSEIPSIAPSGTDDIPIQRVVNCKTIVTQSDRLRAIRVGSSEILAFGLGPIASGHLLNEAKSVLVFPIRLNMNVRK